MTILIKSGTIVNGGCSVLGDIVITDDIISGVYAEGETPRGVYDKIVDASGCFVIPGVIDDHFGPQNIGGWEKSCCLWWCDIVYGYA